MANTANAGYMIPEQIWDQNDPTAYGHVAGEGTGSAAPLAWAMAQYVRLAQGIANGSPCECSNCLVHINRDIWLTCGPTATIRPVAAVVAWRFGSAS